MSTETETEAQQIARLEAELTRALRVASTAETELERLRGSERARNDHWRRIKEELGYDRNVSADVVVNDLRQALRSWEQHREWIDTLGWRAYYTEAGGRLVCEIPVYPHDEVEDIEYRARRFFETRDPSMGGLRWRAAVWEFRETLRDRYGRVVDIGSMLEHPIDGRLVVTGFTGTYGVVCSGGNLLNQGVNECAKIGTDATAEAAYYEQWRVAAPVAQRIPRTRDEALEPPAEEMCLNCGKPGGLHAFPDSRCPLSTAGKFSTTRKWKGRTTV